MHEQGSMSPRDEIARRAARILAEGRAAGIDGALERASREMGLPPGGAPPGRRAMRVHAQAIEESSFGEAGRRARIAAVLEEALDVLAALERTVLEHDEDGQSRRPPELYGRSALGQLDLDPVVHVRVESSLRPHVLAQGLAALGIGEVGCGSLESRHGRLDELRLATARAEHVVLRIPPRMGVDPDRSVVRGETVRHAGYEAISRLIDQLRTP